MALFGKLLRFAKEVSEMSSDEGCSIRAPDQKPEPVLPIRRLPPVIRLEDGQRTEIAEGVLFH